jgi:hypothetical protein
VPAGAPDPRRPRGPRRARGDDIAALVALAASERERAVAVEAIACALTGNVVRIGAVGARRTYEIAEIVGFVAAELDADVRIWASSDEVEVRPPVR